MLEIDMVVGVSINVIDRDMPVLVPGDDHEVDIAGMMREPYGEVASGW